MFQILFFWWTVQATKDNARAALKNTEAIITAERAWVVAELYPMCHRDEEGTWFYEDGTKVDQLNLIGDAPLIYSLRIRNAGRTPAQIVSYRLNYACITENGKDVPEVLTRNPIWDEGFFYFLQPSSEYVEIVKPFNLATSMMKDRKDVQLKKRVASFYGEVNTRLSLVISKALPVTATLTIRLTVGVSFKP